MKFTFVDRKYLIGGKWLRYQNFKNNKGFKIAILRYEFRFYFKPKKPTIN